MLHKGGVQSGGLGLRSPVINQYKYPKIGIPYKNSQKAVYHIRIAKKRHTIHKTRTPLSRHASSLPLALILRRISLYLRTGALTLVEHEGVTRIQIKKPRYTANYICENQMVFRR